jgi:aspartyl-tRNA(Asn)/glutamyl-tRNA(Gln) amidotransferase subunit C
VRQEGVTVELTLEDVRHIATLARIGLTTQEMETMREQLGDILAHVSQLNELDTEAIPPTSQVLALQDVLAADEPRPSYSVDAMLANAPEREGNYFRTKAVLGYET